LLPCIRSLCCTDVTAVTYPSTGKAIGIDLGIKKFAATSNGEYIENPKYYAKYEVKLKKEQKKLSRRAKGGKNRCRQRMKVSRLHQKVKNCRDDFLHKLTTRLLKRYDIICIENLRVANMLKNHKLAKSIADASWSEFRQMLEYKADLRIKIIVVIDPFYPSSQICNRCDSRNQAVKDLKVRTWTCPVCHMYHPDRDFNSAINIRKEGLRILKAA
jgi:putative transposase